MRYLIALTLLVAPVAAGAQDVTPQAAPGAVSFDFKGRRLGDSANVRPRMRCTKDKDVNTEMCVGAERIADRSVIVSHVYLDGRLIYFEFDYDADHFDALRPAFEAKYGTPATAESTPYVTVGGYQYDQVTLTWQLKEGTLEMTKRGDNARRGRAMIADDAGVTKWEERRKAKAAAAAKRDM